MFILKQCWRLRLEASFWAVPQNKKSKNARNANNGAGKVLREEGLGRGVPGGSVGSEAGPYHEPIPRRITCRCICKYVYTEYISDRENLLVLDHADRTALIR